MADGRFPGSAVRNGGRVRPPERLESGGSLVDGRAVGGAGMGRPFSLIVSMIASRAIRTCASASAGVLPKAEHISKSGMSAMYAPSSSL